MAEVYERVEPGTVNSLISMFENKQEPTNGHTPPKKIVKKPSFSKQDLVNNYLTSIRTPHKDTNPQEVPESCEMKRSQHSDGKAPNEIKSVDLDKNYSSIYSPTKDTNAQEFYKASKIQGEKKPSDQAPLDEIKVIDLDKNYTPTEKKVPRAYLGEIEATKLNGDHPSRTSNGLENGIECETKYDQSKIFQNEESIEQFTNDEDAFDQNVKENYTQEHHHEVKSEMNGEIEESEKRRHQFRINESAFSSTVRSSTSEYTETNTGRRVQDRDDSNDGEIETHNVIKTSKLSEISENSVERRTVEDVEILTESSLDAHRIPLKSGRQNEADSILKTAVESIPEKYNMTPTVYPASYWDPKVDCHQLREALQAKKVNRPEIMTLLSQRSNEQRQQIIHQYKTLFHESFVDELKDEVSGDFEDLLVSLCLPRYDFLASELRRAVRGAGTCEDTLIEILCVYNEGDIHQIQVAYESLFGRRLKDDVYEDTSGDFRKILLSILSCDRQDPPVPSSSVAMQLCATDDKGKIALDTDTLRTILASYTRPFLIEVCRQYETTAGSSFTDLVEKLFKGDARKALLALYKNLASCSAFFAEELKVAFKGLGTNDKKLIRIIVSRSELDLEDIKESYQLLYSKSLAAAVKDETSGHYRDGLLSLIEGSNKEDYQKSMFEDLPESNL